MKLVNRITKAMHMIFKIAANFNQYADQILAFKIILIEMKATKYHEDVEQNGTNHRMHILFENGLRQ